MSALRAICLVLAQASKQEKQINLTKLAGAFQTPTASPWRTQRQAAMFMCRCVRPTIRARFLIVWSFVVMPFMALRVRSGDTFGIDPILLDGFLEFLRSPVGLEVLFRFVIACGSTINLSALNNDNNPHYFHMTPITVISIWHSFSRWLLSFECFVTSPRLMDDANRDVTKTSILLILLTESTNANDES